MFSPNLILHSSTGCRLGRILMATQRRRIIALTRNCPWSAWPRRVCGRAEEQFTSRSAGSVAPMEDVTVYPWKTVAAAVAATVGGHGDCGRR